MEPNFNKQPNSLLVRYFEKSKRMFRIELLQFLELAEVVKLALTCKRMMHLLDPNKGKVFTDANGEITQG